MKKGLLAVFLISALVMAIGLTACSSGGNASSEASSEAASSEAATSEAASSEAATSEAASDASAEAASEAAESEGEAVVDASAYGYGGTDPIEAAVYKYLAEEVSKDYDKADASIPTVNIVNVDYTNPDEVLASGDFWVDNYNINGKTLEGVSGGHYPGVMHLSKDGDVYVVTAFDVVEDGANFEASAQKLFGDNFDNFMEVYGDDEAHAELRKITVSDYVNLNGLDITHYQDYGWDPVELYK